RGRLLAGLVVAVVARFGDGSETRHVLAVLEPHDDHALRRAPEALDLVDGHADHRAARRDQHHLVAVSDDPRAGELPLRVGQLDRLHAEAAATLAGYSWIGVRLP